MLGKAFMGEFPRGRELFNFSISGIYGVDFMVESDLHTIFASPDLSHTPTGKEIAGRWEGMLVSDSAITPRTQIFHFESEDGQTNMRYSFANMLRGYSDLAITDTLFRMDDPTPFHDEIRLVTPNLAVGKWVSDWSDENVTKPVMDDVKRYFPIPMSEEHHSWLNLISNVLSSKWPRLLVDLGLSFLGIEEGKRENRSRFGLSFILKRTGKK